MLQESCAGASNRDLVKTRLALLSATALAAGLLVPTLGATAAAGPTTTNACITSVPDKDSSTPQKICYSLFKPAGADARHRCR